MLFDFIFANGKIKKPEITAKFVQYMHMGVCRDRCINCAGNHYRIFEGDDNFKPKVGKNNHLFCDCFYQGLEEKSNW